MNISQQPDPADLAAPCLKGRRRILVVGASGTGKTTLIRNLMHRLRHAGQTCFCLDCDPGLPGTGLPGTLSLTRAAPQGQILEATEPVCTLDAARFRLPVLEAARALLARCPPEVTLLIDTPGLARGIASAELIPALARLVGADLIPVLVAGDEPLPLAHELRSLDARLVRLPVSPGARHLSRSQRREQRSERWRRHMADAHDLTLDPGRLTLLGTPPPLGHARAWEGRQAAVLYRGQLRALGQVVSMTPGALELRVDRAAPGADQILVRDAVYRDERLTTARKARPTPEPDASAQGASEVNVELGALTSIATEPQVAVRAGNTLASLVNGVMGDPLLQLRLVHQRRSLLFDIGDTGRMPLRAAHQVTDLCVSHAHADHIGGFMWLVRCRIGHFPPCRVYGPPGLHRQVAGMINGILWDRVEDRGPVFEVNEFHDTHLKRWRIAAGGGAPEPLPERTIEDGVVHREAGFLIRATRLDHGIPVLAYAFEPRCRLQVRPDRLRQLGLTPGPWLQQLKQAWLAGQWQQVIDPGNGRCATVEELARTLLLTEPGDKLVYATDFRDSADNVARLTDLARGAHTLFCEASFMTRHRDQADRTHHLTTEACARIANLAQVRQLVAFHFSHRYEGRRQQVYDELARYTDRLIVPRSLEKS